MTKLPTGNDWRMGQTSCFRVLNAAVDDLVVAVAHSECFTTNAVGFA
jgi:hypothetical protein